MGDISLDAASAKELNDPILSSMLQLFFQSLGNIAGGLLLMKLIKPSSWYFFKLEEGFCTAESFTLTVGVVSGVVGLLIHFFYR